MNKGCQKCHDVGKPNKDGSIGSCTACHARHAASVELARTPETCGQCHMGPDHSQIEIYHESKHGVLFNAQKAHFNLAARPKQLTTKDMPVPTCATCHMSGLEGQKVTHDVTERLSYWLFAATSEKRPTYQQGQVNMKETCLKCHTTPRIEQFYKEAEAVVDSTNAQVKQADDVMKKLREEKLLTPDPFDEPIEYVYFDLWHYFGRTAKHGAFMGGADFVQWHGFYEMNVKLIELKKQAEELRAARREKTKGEGEGGVKRDPNAAGISGGPTRSATSSCSRSGTSLSSRWTSAWRTRSTRSPIRRSGSRWCSPWSPPSSSRRRWRWGGSDPGPVGRGAGRAAGGPRDGARGRVGGGRRRGRGAIVPPR